MEMLQAMKQKTTPAAVVVKSSPRDSPSGLAAGKRPLLLPPSPCLVGRGRLCPLGTHSPLCSCSAPRAAGAAAAAGSG